MRLKGRVSAAVIVVAAFLSGIMFTTVGANIFDLGDRVGVPSQAAEGTAIEQNLPGATELENAFTQVADRVNPTVVQIRAERLGQQNPNGQQRRNPFEGTPFEDFFGDFGLEQPQPMPRQGMGSGAIIRENGYILTNNHVVEGMDELTVVMMDGTEYDAEIVGADPVSDVAVLKIDVEGLPYISIGNSDDIRVGQWVMAFGSPLRADLSNTVTAGIISATGRVQGGGFAPGFQERPSGPTPTHNFIQTDAAINPGNSGGPLVNIRGELIGVNTAIISRSGGFQGIGFAIPGNTANDIATQLIETGRVERGRLGVSYGPASASLIDALNLPRGAAIVEQVTPGTAADEAGLQSGDVIVSVNGRELTNHQQLSLWIGGMRPGETAEITVNRDGELHTFEVQLGEWEGDTETVAQREPAGQSPREQMMEELGISLSDVTPDLARRAGFENNVEGIIVTNVNPASDAYREANLRAGAVIIEVDRQRVRSLAEFEQVYRQIEPGKTFLVRMRTPGGGTNVTALTKPGA